MSSETNRIEYKQQLTEIKSEDILFSNVAQIIERRKVNAVSIANSQIVLMFWEIGKYINCTVLGMERAEYGKKLSLHCHNNWLRNMASRLKIKICVE